jgi:recombinational DNA repair protein (RecF pathway)
VSVSGTKARAIILKKKVAPGESLYIDCLLDSGDLRSFKIPGILKSATRSSFHYEPGAVHEVIFTAKANERVIPRSIELQFSPYEDTQDYKRMHAVAEIVRLADFLKPGPESAEFFTILCDSLAALPDAGDTPSVCLDLCYFNLIVALGLAANFSDEDLESTVAYDLETGPLTAQEYAERPRANFLLPAEWLRGLYGPAADTKVSAAGRETIRKFLSTV